MKQILTPKLGGASGGQLAPLVSPLPTGMNPLQHYHRQAVSPHTFLGASLLLESALVNSSGQRMNHTLLTCYYEDFFLFFSSFFSFFVMHAARGCPKITSTHKKDLLCVKVQFR